MIACWQRGLKVERSVAVAFQIDSLLIAIQGFSKKDIWRRELSLSVHLKKGSRSPPD
jgi:hypothetical protein